MKKRSYPPPVNENENETLGPEELERMLCQASTPILDAMLVTAMASMARLAGKSDKPTKARLVRIAWEMLHPVTPEGARRGDKG